MGGDYNLYIKISLYIYHSDLDTLYVDMALSKPSTSHNSAG